MILDDGSRICDSCGETYRPVYGHCCLPDRHKKPTRGERIGDAIGLVIACACLVALAWVVVRFVEVVQGMR